METLTNFNFKYSDILDKEVSINGHSVYIDGGSKQSAYGPGKKTVYDCKIDGVLYPTLDISTLKNRLQGKIKKQGTIKKSLADTRTDIFFDKKIILKKNEIRKNLMKVYHKYIMIAIGNNIEVNDIFLNEDTIKRIFASEKKQYDTLNTKRTKVKDLTKKIADIETAIQVNKSLGLDCTQLEKILAENKSTLADLTKKEEEKETEPEK